MFKVLSSLALVMTAQTAFARTDVFFEAGQRENAPALEEGQTLSWGAALSQWNHVQEDAEGALHHGVGETPIGAASDHVIAVMNGGDTVANAFHVDELTPPYSFKGGQYPGEGGSCGDELPPLSACTLVITHAPTELGYYAGMVHAKFHDGDEEHTADLRLGGYGVTPASEEAPKASTDEPAAPADEPKAE